MKKIITIVGARPQFIKSGPVSRAIDQWNCTYHDQGLKEMILHTGQHYDNEMSNVFFEELQLRKPTVQFEAQSGNHGKQTGQILQKVEEIYLQEKPDYVIVYGDTNSTLAGALAAAKLSIPIAHIEAGLRSFVKTMPEEINRVLTDHISNLLFCPTQTAMANLNQENLQQGVYCVGDVMYDATTFNAGIAQKRQSILKDLNLSKKQYILATVHRAENTDQRERLENIIGTLREIAFNDFPIVFPIHPRTRKMIEKYNLKTDPIQLTAPTSYLDMLTLLKNAKVLVTDSGGLQKEACFLQTPCVTVREETEWNETIETRWNILVGTSPDRIRRGIQEIQEIDKKPIGDAFGQQDSSKKIVEILAKHIYHK